MMTATMCPSTDELRALTLGQLAEDQSDLLFEHIRTCEACRSELETVDDLEDSLISSLRQPDPAEHFDAEPDCKLALAKALGTLAGPTHPDGLADMTEVPGTIGEYEIVRPIGRGGMSNVFLARHTKLGRQVALKILASHRLADTRMRERFEAEMRAIGHLSHPNVVAAYDAREVDENAVLVTEYIDGLDLSHLVGRTGPLPIADACELARRVAVALEYTHQQGFVHRDVKPSNVMLSFEGEVKLLDLGLARFQFGEDRHIERTGIGQAMGTADYVAPEQVADSRSVDVRADIYSLGCTLFKLLTGHAPFADKPYDNAFAKMTAHVSTEPPCLSDSLPAAPAGLVKLVASMLAKNPEQRPASPAEVARQLIKFTPGADLRQLAQRAQSLPTNPSRPRPESTPTREVPRAEPLLRRRIPAYVAIASGLGGILLGWCLGVIITIVHPDGSKTSIRPPEGSQVLVQETGTGDGNGQSSQAEAADVRNVGEFSPLSFAVLVADGSQEAIEHAKAELAKTPFGTVVPTAIGIWYPIVEDIEAPVVSTGPHGQRYALVSHERDGRITWEEIHGNVNAMMHRGSRSRESSIELDFNDTLTQLIRRVSERNLNRQLAIVFNNRIVSAPRIRSPLGARVQITGKFTSQELRYLSQCLHGGLVDPLPRPDSGQSPKAEREDSTHAKPLPQEASKTAQPSKLEQTQRNLKRIGLAFQRFHDAHGRYPGTANPVEGAPASRSGKTYPHSWRVAILPFLGQSDPDNQYQDLYEQYRFEESWDSEHNSKLLQSMPDIYGSPFAGDDQEAGETNYLGFAGEQSALGISKGFRRRDFSDGTSNTLLVLETQCTLPWTEPMDIPVQSADDVARAVLFQGRPTWAVMVDGSLRSTPPEDIETLGKMMTRNGGEPLLLR